LAVYITTSIIHNLFISPLRHIPGPKLWAVSEIFFSRLLMSGTGHKKLAELHKKYGEVVRVSPKQVSFNNPQAWKDIYGHRKAGQLENQKDPTFYKLAAPSVIVAEDSDDHGRQRRIMSHAFSAQALMEQQPIVHKYVDLLIKRLKELTTEGGAKVNMVKWYDFTTFDLVGDLSFGEPFGCLEESKYDPWVSMIFAGVKEAVFLIQIRRFIPSIDYLLQNYGKVLLAKLLEHHELTNAKVAKRMARKTDRPDFMQAIAAKDEDGNEVSQFPTERLR
jgi:cytochrome P450